MITRRVSGPIIVTCPYCRAKYGPFQRVSLGTRTCSKVTPGPPQTRSSADLCIILCQELLPDQRNFSHRYASRLGKR